MRTSRISSYPIILLAIFTILLLSISCVPDKKSDIETIQGLWQLDMAMRNGKITQSLDGMYLDFNGPNSFNSNILGDTSSFSSQIEDRQLKVDHNLIRLFDITELSDTLMKLQIEINDDKISLVLKR